MAALHSASPGRLWLCFLVVSLCLLCVGGMAQIPAAPGTPAAATTPAPAAPPAPPPDPLGRTTPRGCVLGFLKAAGARDYARAAKYLDGKWTGDKAEELASELKFLLDLDSTMNIESVSRQPEGSLEELRLSRERVTTIRTPSGPVDIWLDRVQRPNEAPIWLFSRETLRQVPEAYASAQHRDIEKYFPAWTSRVKIFSIPLWRWLLMLFTLGAALLTARLLTRVLLWMLRAFWGRRLTSGVESDVLALHGPTFGLILAWAIHFTAGYSLTALARHFWSVTSTLLGLISGAWMLMRLADIFASYLCHRLTMQMKVERVTFVALLARLFKILVGIALVIVLLTQAGVDVSAVVAGLGIGGIALALAAQKTLADLFGGISLVMRGSVRVGDLCKVGGQTGMVEQIGMSALRVRTLDRSVMSVPNSKVAEAGVENLSMRDQFWVHQIFTLRFDTPYSVMQRVLGDVLNILRSRAYIDQSSARARVIQLTVSGPQIEVFAYYQKPGSDYPMFLEEQEKIILEIMRVVEEAGTGMAGPIGVVRMNDGRDSQETTSRRAPVDITGDGL